MNGVLFQLQAFVLTSLLGVVAGLIFHFYQTTIRKAGVNRIILYVFDVIIWILMIIIVFLAMLFINEGEMRVYVLLALIAGIILYYYKLTRLTGNAVNKGAEAIVKVIGWILELIFNPILYAVRWVKEEIKKLRPTPPPDDEE